MYRTKNTKIIYDKTVLLGYRVFKKKKKQTNPSLFNVLDEVTVFVVWEV